ncbi:MAG: nucleotide exchange factor GrpE [Candidatus Aenigmarchaeota archaeon]|nr:nucleotide exchange factor GrpE [Candidatus Aenigmarchaeota archaeon]
MSSKSTSKSTLSSVSKLSNGPQNKSQKKQNNRLIIEKLNKQFIDCQNKAREYLAGWQRTQADYANREKEIDRQKEQWIKLANLTLILEIIPIYDNLQKAVLYYQDNLSKEKDNQQWQQWSEGVKNIKQQFDNLLSKLHINKIKTIDEIFNPNFHEAVGKISKQDNQSNDKEEVIAQEVEAGYQIDGQVIKPAKVIVK